MNRITTGYDHLSINFDGQELTHDLTRSYRKWYDADGAEYTVHDVAHMLGKNYAYLSGYMDAARAIRGRHTMIRRRMDEVRKYVDAALRSGCVLLANDEDRKGFKQAIHRVRNIIVKNR